MWWLVVIAAALCLVTVVVVRACAFRPRTKKTVAEAKVYFDGDRAVAHLQEMLRCKTVSYRDPSLVDEAEFERFRNLLVQLYPKVHARCKKERIGKSGILYYLPGQSSDSPSVFMSHYDVVPAREEAWQKPAFEGILEDGVLWGRGALDTKGTLLGVLESAEVLLEKGFVPKQDMYFAFSGDEEIAGPSASAIVDVLEQRGIRPGLVVDEGGAVVDDMVPGVRMPCALIGTGEKGMMDLEFRVNSQGGHASAPPAHTPIGLLAKACVSVEKHPFPSELVPPAAEMFDTLGRYAGFGLRVVMANLWLFYPLLNRICRRHGGELNALIRTTIAFTQMEGSKSSNVLPPEARMVANLRLTGSMTMERAVAYLRDVINNPAIELRILRGNNPSKYSSTKSEGWEKLTTAVAQTWPGVLISPYLMVACSDSRHFCRISDHVYRFSAMAASPAERATVHGNDERITVDKIITLVAFYIRLLQQC